MRRKANHVTKDIKKPSTPMQPMMPMMPQMPIMPMPCPGYPVGMPPQIENPVDFEIEPGPPVIVDKNYLQGYLKTLIGKFIRVDFIVGTNMFVDKEGTLEEVGIDHIVLRQAETNDLIVCDLYSIKFVKVFE
ncbi:hypothetical protein [Caloranaerobacter sp. DY30410]|uniref:hypothetical protein n=1 Tax=Caloranaerobacter sp. DY30410 TaxID=3238305 RepID=UPI003D044C4A